MAEPAWYTAAGRGRSECFARFALDARVQEASRQVSLAEVFTPGDHRAIETAVREVEARSAGEVVPYAVERSDRYERALWSASTLGALAATALAAVAWAWQHWSGPVVLWIALP